LAELDQLLGLIEDLCTTEQIKEILDPARGVKGVRITASTKHALVQENLRGALAREALGLDSLHRLLNESEENGNQHIFYYKLSARDSELLVFESVSRLLGYSESNLAQFPKLELIPNGFVIADVRLWGSKKPKDWVVKVYGDETRDFFTGRIIQEEDGKYLKEFGRKRFRHVLMLRWNSSDLLEVRVPRDTSRIRVREWLNKAWEIARPAFQKSSFRDWDLSKARANLIAYQERDHHLYHLNDTQVEGDHHERITFESYDPQGDLFAGQATKEAVKSLLDADGKCTRLNVTWLATRGAPIQEDLRAYVGAESVNEVIVPAHCDSRAIEYVTEQLRKYSRS
jgi:hypothetical protein